MILGSDSLTEGIIVVSTHNTNVREQDSTCLPLLELQINAR